MILYYTILDYSCTILYVQLRRARRLRRSLLVSDTALSGAACLTLLV